MSTFSDDELSFLREGPGLGRIATVDADGTPHVVPTGWSYNSGHGTIDVGGIELERTRKYRNAARTRRAALVIDDVLPPWRPRAVMVQGTAEALDGLIRIHPEHIVSWGVEGAASAPGRPAAPGDDPGEDPRPTAPPPAAAPADQGR